MRSMRAAPSVPPAHARNGPAGSDPRSGRIAWVSGSPNRQLNSSTFGPRSVSISPAYRTPRYGTPSAAMAVIVRSSTSVRIRSAVAPSTNGTGVYAPMPPVFGPASSSPTRLKSCANASATALVPSASPNAETSRPSRCSSTTTVEPASPNAPSSSERSIARTASPRSSVMTTPLPAARPSAFTTYGGPNASSASTASSTVRAERFPPAGIPWRSQRSLAQPFEPSRRAAAAEGPNTARPRWDNSSARPATSGPSGPTTVRSTSSRSARATRPWRSSAATGTQVACCAMPGFPGAASSSDTEGSRARRHARACSRPPDPTTRTLVTRG
jgi:hypothetical protein